MRTLRTPLVALAAAAWGLATVPAGAASGGTAATLTLTPGGSLTVGAADGAATIDLGSTASGYGRWTTGGLGTVTVTDTRTGYLNDDWTATASVSDFTLRGPPPAGATPAQCTIPASSIAYDPGVVGAAATGGYTGAAVFTSVGGPVVAGAVTVGSMLSAGPNTASWDPTLTITLTDQPAGTYEGTITHSAA